MIDLSNTELKRNKVIYNNGVIKKSYSNNNHYLKEKMMLEMLKEEKLIPNLLNVENNILTLEFIEGDILEKVLEFETNSYNYNKEQKLVLYKEMGKLLNYLHSKYFLNEFKDENYSNYKDFEKQRLEKRYKKCLELNRNTELITKAYLYAQKLLESIEFEDYYVFCHHDYSERNILIKKEKIVGIIDFELAYLANHCSDLAKMNLKNYSNDNLISFYDGYFNSKKEYEKNKIKILYFTIVLCIEICSWAYEKANDYYNQALTFLENNF